MYRLKKKNKVYHVYEDFYKKSDLKDPEITKIINLTLEDFSASGEVINPRAPCVVTTIDPEYTKHATLRHRTSQFRMKTDILALREITRKKFMIYATQQRYLEKKREAAFQDEIYNKIKQHQEFIVDALRKMESNAFSEMKKTQKQLEKLQKNKISEELKNEISEHQRVLMEVQEVYGRFLFLLKLIGYFDDIIAPEDIEDDVNKSEAYKLPQPKDIVQFEISERCPIGKKEVSYITDYMSKVVRPYLSKRNHLNADIWIKGYERTRQKLFNYSRRYTNVALLNHLVAIVNEKSEKTLARYTKKPIFLKDPEFLKERIEVLKHRTKEVFDDFERKQKKDEIQNKLFAILPVILEKIELKFSQSDVTKKMESDKTGKNKILLKSSKTMTSTLLDSKNVSKSDGSIIEKVEKLQWYLMCLLQDLEKISKDKCKKLENEVRKRIQTQKDLSRRVLEKQNRLLNWMEHFKKHEMLRRNN